MTRTTRYIISPGYDWTFFLAPPLAAMVVGLLIADTRLTTTPLGAGDDGTPSSLFLGVLIHAHLVAVFLRSHGNPEVRQRFPIRFFIVPPILFGALLVSPWIAVAATVVATFWDVWHSGAQTFGFGRIYDRNHSARRDEGRRLDFWINQLVYAGPILAGATLMDHVIVLEEFEVVDGAISDFLVLAPSDLEGHAATLRWVVLVVGVVFVAFYLWSEWRLFRRGRPASPLKVWLLSTTALCSIVTWGFNPWGEAFFIMNAFHAVQYLALIWATEGTRLTAALGLARVPFGRGITLTLALGVVVLYGCIVELIDPAIESFWALTMVVSLMHFWYDAFVWSVRKKHV